MPAISRYWIDKTKENKRKVIAGHAAIELTGSDYKLKHRDEVLAAMARADGP